MTEFIDYIQQGKVSKVKDSLVTQLQDKLNDKVELRKKEIASTMFTGEPSTLEQEEVNESIPEVFDEANKLGKVVKDVLDAWAKERGSSLVPSSSDKKKLKTLVKDYAKKYKVKEKELTKAIEIGQVEGVDIINNLKEIKDSKESTYVTFKDNSKLKIDEETSDIILQVYEKLNEENKEKLISTLEQNQTNFLKMTDFAFRCLKDN